MEDLSLKYKGIVKVKKYKKGRLVQSKTLKNTGTSRLFYILCMYLCGQANNGNWLPKYLDVGYFDSDGWISALNNLPILEVTAPTEGSQNSTSACSITFQTSITSSYIKGASEADDGTILSFALMDQIGDRKNVLAHVLTGDTSTGWGKNWNIATDEVYIISWILEIGNDSSEQSTTTITTLSTTTPTIEATVTKKSRTRKVTTNAK